MLYFSPDNRGFYDSEIHGTIPAGAVPISAEQHESLLEAQAAGATIVAQPDGSPAAEVPVVGLEDQRLQAAAAVRREAQRRIDLLVPAWQQSNDNADLAMAAYQLASASSTTIDVAAALARRAQIDAIRAASDAIEAPIAAMTAEQLAAFDPTDDAHWS